MCTETMNTTTQLTDRQIRRRNVCMIPIEANLSDFVKSPSHEDNEVTKKAIFERTTKGQQSEMEYYHKDGLTWQDLDPALNRYGSVRYQFIKNSGHLLRVATRARTCNVEGCDHLFSETRIWFTSFGDSTQAIQLDTVRCDDIHAVGTKGTFAGHMFEAHAEESAKRLKAIGVSLK